MMDWLGKFRQLNVEIHDERDLREYFEKYPDCAEALLFAVVEIHRKIYNSTISMELYVDPEDPTDRIATVTVDGKHLTEEEMETIHNISVRALSMVSSEGWTLVTF